MARVRAHAVIKTDTMLMQNAILFRLPCSLPVRVQYDKSVNEKKGKKDKKE